MNLIWNSSHCIQCTGGRYYNPSTRQCECQTGYWNGYVCGTACSNGMVWNVYMNVCECPKRSYSYNGGCIPCGSIVEDSARSECKCPIASTYWNGYDCVLCDRQRIFDPVMVTCSCPDTKRWNGSDCISVCPKGYDQVGKLCICPLNTYELNGQCVTFTNCTNGMIWNNQNNRC